ncbi:hypothetical protein CPC08DRAFT_196241 [Agrocybe pediades]|nr:hypothetical protein CPC08DRAFT_196241 [Agrocybe pediades]
MPHVPDPKHWDTVSYGRQKRYRCKVCMNGREFDVYKAIRHEKSDTHQRHIVYAQDREERLRLIQENPDLEEYPYGSPAQLDALFRKFPWSYNGFEEYPPS